MNRRDFAREAVDGPAFSAWLRGGSVPEDILALSQEIETPIETKGNPNHDPATGRFTFGPGGSGRPAYQGMTAHGVGTIKPVGGGGKDRNGRPRPELFAPDPYALKTPVAALAHYIGRSGEGRNFYLHNVEMLGLSTSDFPEMRKLVAQGKPGVYLVARASGSFNGTGLRLDKTLSTGAMIGGLALHADGSLAIAKTGAY